MDDAYNMCNAGKACKEMAGSAVCSNAYLFRHCSCCALLQDMVQAHCAAATCPCLCCSQSYGCNKPILWPTACRTTSHHGIRQPAQQLWLIHCCYCDLVECAVWVIVIAVVVCCYLAAVVRGICSLPKLKSKRLQDTEHKSDNKVMHKHSNDTDMQKYVLALLLICS